LPEHDVSAEGVRELHAHVPQPAKADDADRLPRTDVPVTQRRVGRDAGAEERSDGGEGQPVRDAQRERFVHDDALGVAAVGDASGVCVRAVIREHWKALAELFESLCATGARATRADHAADAGQVTLAKPRDGAADADNLPDDLVPGDAGVDRVLPLVTGLVQIRMADAAIQNLNVNVARTHSTPFDRERLQVRGR
jgi:hypothetical protein